MLSEDGGSVGCVATAGGFVVWLILSIDSGDRVRIWDADRKVSLETRGLESSGVSSLLSPSISVWFSSPGS